MGNNFMMAQLSMGGAVNLFSGNSQNTGKTALGFTASGTSFAQQFKAILEQNRSGREADSNDISFIGEFKKQMSNRNPNPSILSFNGRENSAKPNIMTKEKQSELLKNLQHSKGVEFLSNLKQYFMSSHHELGQISLGEGAVKEIETLLVGAGFHPEDIRGLIETLKQDEEDGALNVSDLMDGVMALDPERIVTDESEIKKNLISLHSTPDSLDYGNAKSDDASNSKQSKVKAADNVILDSALIPFLQTIFNEIGLPDERSASIIDAAEVKGEGIDTNQLIQQIEALQKEGFWSGKSFQTTSIDQHAIVKRSLHQIEVSGVDGDVGASYLNDGVSPFNDDFSDDEPMGLADLINALKRMEINKTQSSVVDTVSVPSSVETSLQSNLQNLLVGRNSQESEQGRQLMASISRIASGRRSLFMEDGVIHQGVNHENEVPSFQSVQGEDDTGKILLNSLEALASEDLEASDVHQLVDQLRSRGALSEPNAALSAIHSEDEGGVSLRERVLKTVLTDLLNSRDEEEPRFEIAQGELKSSIEGSPENYETVSSLGNRTVKNVLMDLLNPLDDGEVEALGSKLDLNSLIALSNSRPESTNGDGDVFPSAEDRTVKSVLLDLLNKRGEVEKLFPEVSTQLERLNELVSTISESESESDPAFEMAVDDRPLKNVLLDLLNKRGEVEKLPPVVSTQLERLNELVSTISESESESEPESEMAVNDRPLKNVLLDLLNKRGEVEKLSPVVSIQLKRLNELVSTISESESESDPESEMAVEDRPLRNVLLDLLNKRGEVEKLSPVVSTQLEKLSELVSTISESESESDPESEMAVEDRPLRNVLLDLLNKRGEVEKLSPVMSTQLIDPVDGDDISPKSEFFDELLDSKQNLTQSQASIKTVLADMVQPSERSDGIRSEFSEFDSVDDTAVNYKSDTSDLEGRFQKSRFNPYGNNELKKSPIEFAAVSSPDYDERDLLMTSMGDEFIEPFINEDGVELFSQGETIRHGKDGVTEPVDRRSIKSFDSPLPIREKSDGNTSSDSGQNGSGFSGNPDMKDGQLGVVREKTASSPLPSYVTNQVFKGIRRAFNRGDSEIRLQLKPIELGKIFMTIDTHGDSIKVSVVTENQSAKELLAGHANDLKATLAASGIQIDRFDVAMGSDFSRSLADSGRQFDGSGSSNSGQKRARGLRQTKVDTADQEGIASSVKLASESNALHFVA